MKKSILLGFLLISLLMPLVDFGFFCNASTGTAHVYLSPAVVPTASLGVGSTFEIDVEIENVANLWCWCLNLTWDPDVLTMASSPVEGSFLKQGGSTLYFVTPPKEGYIAGISSALTSWGDGVTGSGLLATVEFEVVSLGSSNIDISYCSLTSNFNSTELPIDFTSTGSTFNGGSSTPESTANVYLSPAVVPTASLEVGSTFEIDIKIENVINLWQWSLGLSWDPDVLKMVGSPVEGSFLKSGGTTSFNSASVNNTIGLLSTVSSALASSGGVTGSGLLATVEFEVVSLGSSNIAILNLLLQENLDGGYQSIDATSTDSTFNAGGSSSAPSSEGAQVDVYTDRGGLLANVSSDAYGPHDLVVITANVTYNGYSVVGKQVVFEIRDSNNALIFTRSNVTDDEGKTMVDFRLPWSGLNPEELFGDWTVVATVDVSGEIVTDVCEFLFSYILEINENKKFTDLYGNAVDEVSRGQSLRVVVDLDNNRDISVNCLVCVSIFDECEMWLVSAKTEVTVPANGGSAVLTFVIPSWAVVGQASVYFNVLTNLSPLLGGISYCPEDSEVFLIAG